MRWQRGAAVLALALVVTPVAACSSSSKSDQAATTTTTTTAANNKEIAFQTDDGQVSLSLNGNLPPGWPKDFPIPEGATPAGSGSLGTDTVKMIGVFKTSQDPADVYDFYKTNSELTVDSSNAAGIGPLYVGTVQFSGTYTGRATIGKVSGDTLIVIALDVSSTTGTTGGSTSGTAGSGAGTTVAP